jgi:ferredoxin
VIAPEVFRVEDVAVVVGSAPDELIVEAARACPSAAIRLVDSDTGAQVYP